MTDNKDKNNNHENKSNENQNNKDQSSGFSFEDLQRQLQDAMKNLGSNSFIMPIKAPKQQSKAEKEKAEKEQKEKEANQPKEALEVIKHFSLKPKEVKEYLDRFVIKQEEAKKVLSVAVCDHYNHIRKCMANGNSSFGEHTKQNVILLGPTGVGKTYLIKCLANLIGVPFVKGLLGGKGEREPVVKKKVKFIAVDGSDLKFEPAETVSSSGGEVAVTVIAGNTNGDQYFKVVPEGSKKTMTVRIITGIGLEGANQETYVGENAKKPVKLKVVDKFGKPVENANVYFSVASSPEKKLTAKCSPAVTKTNKDGIAETKVKIGEETGLYEIRAEVSDKVQNIHYRGIQITQMGISIIGLVITVLGGLALFIFGMKLMSDGLQIIAGQKMKRILHFFTKNRFVAVLAGIIVTGAIQSSSACTVMVVGFVNAGLLNLAQAIGIVFGANIGTTVTAQMISFKLEGLALPAIIIGAVMMMFTKKSSLKGAGQTIFGFGMLFFGMGMMGSELKLLSKFPSFVSFFSHFDCSPVNGAMPFWSIIGAVAIGTAMTVLIQSSSATIGIAISLAMGGLINFYTAVPLILGDNIGTTITAILASLGANKRAKQTAVAHMLFNVLGAVYMIILLFVLWPGTNVPVYLYLINSITPGNVFAAQPENIARHIAMAHTLFNVFNVILFLPFIPLIARLCNIIIKIKDEKSIAVQYLEPHLLKTPSIAIRQSVKVVTIMLNDSWMMLERVIKNGDLNRKIKDKALKFIQRKEEEVDRMQADATDYLVKVSRQELSMSQSAIIPLLMHCTNDAEKLADYTEVILNLSDRYKNVEGDFTEEAQRELKLIWQLVNEQYTNIMEYFEKNDSKNIRKALKRGRKIQSFVKKYELNHLKRLKCNECSFQSGMVFVEMLGVYLRISNQLNNVAERIPEIQKHYGNLN